MTLTDVFSKLRKKNRKNYTLYLVCNFVALLLITAYSTMMLSPTVLTILPEGGDSRKQVVAIFVMACVGCVVFTIYAASIFFRMKSKEIGTLMALGASKKQLGISVFRETTLICVLSTLAGTICGIPFAWILWQSFQLFIVSSEEMAFRIRFQSLLISAGFILIVLFFAFWLGKRMLNHTNIMDIVNEEHKNEPIRDVKPWFAPVGLLLLFGGAIIGYMAPSVYMSLFQQYSPAWLNALYIPVFIGLYMLLLHVVVRGFGWRKKTSYKGIISRSMMKFQGRQTVNNMMVVTVLIAGAAFAIFYIPMLGSGQIIATKERTFDYAYHYPQNQKIPKKAEIEQLASEYQLRLKDWKEEELVVLGLDGVAEVEGEGSKYHYEYRELCEEGKFLSEDAYEGLTGKKADVRKGTYKAVTDKEESSVYMLSINAKLLSNMVTEAQISTKFGGFLYDSLLLDDTGYYVLNNHDYNKISTGLKGEWMEKQVFFNVDGKDSYAFADQFFNLYVDSFGKECEYPAFYDRVSKISDNKRGEVYWGDTESMTTLSYDRRDSSDFRLYWRYMPKIRILDSNDFLRSFAVYLMMFLFISIVCIMAAMIICYTRCITIAINNRYVFDDLKRLGASPRYLIKEIKRQAFKVFAVPSAIGMIAMYFLYCMIMYGNDGRIISSEVLGLTICFGILIFLAGLIGIVYQATLKKMRRMLNCA